MEGVIVYYIGLVIGWFIGMVVSDWISDYHYDRMIDPDDKTPLVKYLWYRLTRPIRKFCVKCRK